MALPRFEPHFNRALADKANPNGKYFISARDYYGELKKRGLEPYDPKGPDRAHRKPYKASQESKELVRAIMSHKGPISEDSRIGHAMTKKGVKFRISREDLKKLPAQYQTGGMY